jgi:hypothetical protein
LRLFRYENQDAKVVAERTSLYFACGTYIDALAYVAHNDLGLLSFVIGDTPGLEVCNKYTQDWFAVERTYTKPAATVLVGRELERYTNYRYIPGGHLVRSYPDAPPSIKPALTLPLIDQATPADSETTTAPDDQGLPDNSGPSSHAVPQPKYRFSIVFVLRSHWPVTINTDSLTSSVTGQHKYPIRNTTAKELFEKIRGAHFNINTGLKEREEQKAKLQASKQGVRRAPASTQYGVDGKKEQDDVGIEERNQSESESGAAGPGTG